ncbi:MAG: hypothetical protein ABIJ81_01885 [Patescibacteria group bacterium]
MANRRNRLWLGLFILITLIVILGVLLLVLPKIEYTISPKTEELKIDLLFKIDIDAKEPIYNLRILPGRLLEPGDDFQQLQKKGYILAQTDNLSVIYQVEHYQELINFVLKENVPSNKILIRQDSQIQLGDWSASVSGKQISNQLDIESKVYYYLPTNEWQVKLRSLSAAEGKLWLESRPNVVAVNYHQFFAFFANISQKMLKLDPRVVLLLDR